MSGIKILLEQDADRLSTTEIERKFLVVGNEWRDLVTNSYQIIQTYISHKPVVRIRLIDSTKTALITIKSPLSDLSCREFEYEVPYQDALDMYDIFKEGTVSKFRHIYRDPKTGHVWEIDEFLGTNQGLIVAEIELFNENDEINTEHLWLGEEVTSDKRYSNSSLATSPFKDWK